MPYTALGRPEALPADFWSCFPSQQRPPYSEVQELASKGQMHATDAGVVLLVRQLSPPPAPGTQRPVGRTACSLNDEPICVYVPLLMHPWVMQACHSTASCFLGLARTLCMLEGFYWWIGMSICTGWWLRNCLKCQARKTLRQTVRGPPS